MHISVILCIFLIAHCSLPNFFVTLLQMLLHVNYVASPSAVDTLPCVHVQCLQAFGYACPSIAQQDYAHVDRHCTCSTCTWFQDANKGKQAKKHNKPTCMALWPDFYADLLDIFQKELCLAKHLTILQ